MLVCYFAFFTSHRKVSLSYTFLGVENLPISLSLVSKTFKAIFGSLKGKKGREIKKKRFKVNKLFLYIILIFFMDVIFLYIK